MRQRFLAIVNPISGRTSVLPRVQQVRDILAHHGGAMEISVTRAPGDASRFAAELDSRVDGVLVAGGDGTACEVFNGLDGKQMPVTVLSSGTENLLARELGMPREPAAVAEALMNGAVSGFDVGVLNGRRFLVVAGVGFDAECVERMTRARRGHITHWDYFWPIWRTFWGHSFPRMQVECDGQIVFDGRGLTLIGNLSRYSVGLRPLAKAVPTDGLLDVVAFECGGKLDLIRHALKVLKGEHIGKPNPLPYGRGSENALRVSEKAPQVLNIEHIGSPGVFYRQCATVRITSAGKVPVEADGEFAGYLPLEARVVPNGAWLAGCGGS